VNRLNSGINPIYYLAKPSDDVFEKDFWIHVLQAYDVSEIRNGSFTISFWDVNYNELESIKTKVEVKIVKDDKGRSHIKAIFGDLPPGFDDLSNGLKGKKELFDNPFELSGIFEIRKDKEDIVSFINNEDNFDFCDRHRINNTSICYSSIDQYQN
jgi:hypothetical protein